MDIMTTDLGLLRVTVFRYHKLEFIVIRWYQENLFVCLPSSEYVTTMVLGILASILQFKTPQFFLFWNTTSVKAKKSYAAQSTH